jgi:tetratricopeptide (TPR) repeat protein
LIASDPVIRNAVINLKWGKASTLDDATISRLYLAGIISGSNNGQISIKNRVLDAALSDEWLDQIAISDVGMLDAAAKEYSQKRFSGTITLIDEYVKANPHAPLPLESRIQLGIALVHEGQDSRAIEHLQASVEVGDLGNLYAPASYYLTTALFREGRLEEAVAHLETPLDRKEFQRASQLTLSSALISRGGDGDFERSLDIARALQQAIEQEKGVPKLEDREILASSYFNAAMALKGVSRHEEAMTSLQEAYRVSPIPFRPALILARLQFTKSESERREIAIVAAKEILENRLVFEMANSAALRFSESVLASTIDALLQHSQSIELVTQLVEYACVNLMPGPQTPFLSLVKIADGARKLPERSSSRMIWFALDHLQDLPVSSDDRIRALRSIIQINIIRVREAWKLFVLELKSGNANLGEEDYGIIFAKVLDYLKEKDNHALLELVEAALASNQVGESSLFFNFILRYHRLLALQNLRRHPEAREAAREIIDQQSGKLFTSDDDPENDMKSYVDFVMKQVFDYFNANTHDPLKNIRRNQRVQVRQRESNIVKVTKFKYVERDLRAGILVLDKTLD